MAADGPDGWWGPDPRIGGMSSYDQLDGTWFSILVHKLLRRGNFTSKAHLKQRIEAFIAYFNQTMAKPFRWTMKGRPLTV